MLSTLCAEYLLPPPDENPPALQYRMSSPGNCTRSGILVEGRRLRAHLRSSPPKAPVEAAEKATPPPPRSGQSRQEERHGEAGQWQEATSYTRGTAG